MTETIKVSESLELHAVAENHVKPLYQLKPGYSSR